MNDCLFKIRAGCRRLPVLRLCRAFLRLRPFHEHLLPVRPFRNLRDEDRPHLRKIAVDIHPLIIRKVLHRDRQKDVLVLVDHLAHAPDHRKNRFLQLLCACSLKAAGEPAHLRLDLIVDAPHDLARAGDPVTLQRRHDQLFLLPVQSADFLQAGHRQLNLVIVSAILKRHLKIVQDELKRTVLADKVIDRVTFRKLKKILLFHPLLLADDLAFRLAVEKRGVQVAELRDLSGICSIFDQLLLRRHNVLHRDILE